MISWRAGCGESRTSGSGGGSGKRTGRNDRHRAPSRPHLAADKLTACSQRVQQDTCGHRGRTGDALYGIRRILLTRTDLLTDKQKAKLNKALVAHDAHAAVEVTACYYQDLIGAYANPDRRAGKLAMFKCLKRSAAGPQPMQTPPRDPGLRSVRPEFGHFA